MNKWQLLRICVVMCLVIVVALIGGYMSYNTEKQECESKGGQLEGNFISPTCKFNSMQHGG